jgi:HAD-hyrolase-like
MPGAPDGGKDCYVIGDAVWDLMAARRAGMLNVGLLSGGYSQDEMIQKGVLRIFHDPTDFHNYLDELGVLSWTDASGHFAPGRPLQFSPVVGHEPPSNLGATAPQVDEAAKSLACG